MKVLIAFAVIMIGAIFPPFIPHASGASSLVEGDCDVLIPLSHTEYLDNHPVLFLSCQTEGLDILSKVDNVIVTESVEGLILDLIGGKYTLRLSRKRPFTFRPQEQGVYQMWVRGVQSVCVHLTSHQDTYCVSPGERKDRRWSKLGETELSQDACQITLMDETDKEREIVVVPAKVMEMSRREIESKGIHYLWYIKKVDTP